MMMIVIIIIIIIIIIYYHYNNDNNIKHYKRMYLETYSKTIYLSNYETDS